VDEKGRVFAAEHEAFVKYLDYRIPQLHTEGKKRPGPTAKDTPLHKRIQVCRENAESSSYPGVVARDIAEREFVAGARVPE
jgi:hypothetical protein